MEPGEDKMKRTALAVPLLAILCAPASLAKTGHFYAGGHVNYTQFKTINGDLQPLAATAQVGYQFNEYLGTELRAGAGVNSDDEASLEAKIKDHYGLYITAGTPLSDWSRLYAITGFSSIKAELHVPNERLSHSESGLSYGAGVSFSATKQFKVHIEYLQLLDRTDFDIRTLNLGVTYHF
ncbi:porin family protein [Ferrimonas pelagia]|uniref:Outer membrane protein beta-barrel domain-containing protein n=1 Tax=Ferrimonas pelagia TaxID=1177826 RepID=A0ABP9FG00_9GAMM